MRLRKRISPQSYFPMWKQLRKSMLTLHMYMYTTIGSLPYKPAQVSTSPDPRPEKIHVQWGKFNAIISGLGVRRQFLRSLPFLVPPPGSNHKSVRRRVRTNHSHHAMWQLYVYYSLTTWIYQHLKQLSRLRQQRLPKSWQFRREGRNRIVWYSLL